MLERRLVSETGSISIHPDPVPASRANAPLNQGENVVKWIRAHGSQVFEDRRQVKRNVRETMFPARKNLRGQ
ncbi:hypothetical protein SAMN05216316_1858 [Nitrosovibrio sp. Nv6]|nr:hypothetical protein SAMN05216316_1858 [Nitrosovibrio sp. Nv6]